MSINRHKELILINIIHIGNITTFITLKKYFIYDPLKIFNVNKLNIIY
jgi:hypothetical protein